MLVLAEAHAEEVRRSEQHRNLGSDLDISLLWRSAARAAPGDTLVSLSDLVLNSRNQSGYIPALAQEVLLNSFGGQDICREVLDAAARLRRSKPSLASGIPEQSDTRLNPEDTQTGLTQMVSEMDVDDDRPPVTHVETTTAPKSTRRRSQNSSVAPCVATVGRTKPETAGGCFSI